MPSGSSAPAVPFFLEHLASESARFRAVLADAPSGLRVPTCPDWDADDLVWHLADVQWFWGEIAQGRLTTQAEVDALDGRRVDRPQTGPGCSTASTARAAAFSPDWRRSTPAPSCGCGPMSTPPATSRGVRPTRR